MSGLFDDVMIGLPLAKAFCKGVGKLGKAAVKAGKEVYDSGVIQETAANVGKKISEMDLHIQVCPKCGAKQIPGMKFCPKCGAKLPEKKTAVDTEETYSYDDENWDEEPSTAASHGAVIHGPMELEGNLIPGAFADSDAVLEAGARGTWRLTDHDPVIQTTTKGNNSSTAFQAQSQDDDDDYWERVQEEERAQAQKEEDDYWEAQREEERREQERAAAAFFLMEEENNWEL